MRVPWILVVLAACGGAPPARGGEPRPPPVAVDAPPVPVAEIVLACELPAVLRDDGLYEVRAVPPELTAAPNCRSTYVMHWLQVKPGTMAVGDTDDTRYWANAPISDRDDGDTLVLALSGGASDLRCAGDGEQPGTYVDIDLPDQRPGPSWAMIYATDRPIRFEYRYAIGDCAVEVLPTTTIVRLGGRARMRPVAAVPYTGPRSQDDPPPTYEVIGEVLLVHVPFEPEWSCTNHVGSYSTPAHYRFTDIAVPAVARRVVLRPELQPESPPCS